MPRQCARRGRRVISAMLPNCAYGIVVGVCSFALSLIQAERRAAKGIFGREDVLDGGEQARHE